MGIFLSVQRASGQIFLTRAARFSENVTNFAAQNRKSYKAENPIWVFDITSKSLLSMPISGAPSISPLPDT